MKKFNRKRAVIAGGAVVTIGAAAALLIGSTFGFFSSAGTASGNNTFTAGKVVVGLGAGTQVTCTIRPMSPGDTQASNGSSGQNAACQYDVQYTGNVNAFMALDLAITGSPGTSTAVPYTQTTAPTAAQGLYDGTANGLQFSITDGASTSYMSGVNYKVANALTGTPTVLSPTTGGASVTDLLVNTSAMTNNTTVHITVNYTLPLTAGNAYNLATSTLVLTIHAVQADNNPLPAACNIAGAQCSTAAGMNWS